MDRNSFMAWTSAAVLVVASREGGVDRNADRVTGGGRTTVASREGGVDRNDGMADCKYHVGAVASREGGVDRNEGGTSEAAIRQKVASREGGVDRNIVSP